MSEGVGDADPLGSPSPSQQITNNTINNQKTTKKCQD